MATQEDLEALMTLYRQERSQLSARKLAEIEHELWDLKKLLMNPEEAKKGPERRDWFSQEFGKGPSEYEVRATLFNAGACAAPLWRGIDRGVFGLYVARKLLSDAKDRRRRTAEPLGPALVHVLKDGGYEILLEDPIPSKPDTPVSIPDMELNPASPAVFNKRVKSMAEAYIVDRTEGLEQILVNNLRDEFLWAISIALDELTKKIAYHRGVYKKHRQAEISRNDFENACMKLGIRAKWKKQLTKERVNRAYVKRAFEVHPDRNKAPNAQEEFLAVGEAKDLLLKYSEVYSNGR